MEIHIDLEAGIDWYSRLFGRPSDLRAGEEILRDIDEHATLFIRHVKIPDPDGNAIAFAEPPGAASASPRSAGTGASAA